MKMRHRKDLDVDLNLTPLIDVVFLLLIFFMVTTTFKQTTHLSLELPDSQAGESSNLGETIQIMITKNGNYYLKGKPFSSKEPQKLKEALKKAIGNHDAPVITIVGDKLAPHQSVVTALDVVSQLGISKVSIQANDVGSNS